MQACILTSRQRSKLTCNLKNTWTCQAHSPANHEVDRNDFVYSQARAAPSAMQWQNALSLPGCGQLAWLLTARRECPDWLLKGCMLGKNWLHNNGEGTACL